MGIKSKKALFLIHGFTEDCEKSFGRFLMHSNFKNFDIIKHTVHGHDGVNDFDYESAIEKLTQEYSLVREAYDKVYVLGFSMGGVLGCYLSNNFRVDKLVLIAPAFKCILDSKVFSLIGDASKELVKNRADFFSVKEEFENYFSDKYKSKDIVYSDLSFSNISDLKTALVNFRKLVGLVGKDFEKITCPTLIIHGENDELVSIDSSLFVLSKVTNGVKLMLIAPNCFHRVLNEEGSEKYYSAIESFIKSNYVSIDLGCQNRNY